MGLVQEFRKGLWRDNPLFKLVLGLCPALAVTTTAVNGLGMGVATSFVLMLSNIFISVIRNAIPDNVRIPAYIVVIASFVTVTDYVMGAYTPDLHESLGIFIPLIVVNCIILGRAEAFAGKNKIVASAADGLGMGIGFTIALLMVSGARELLGGGSLFGFKVFGEGFQPSVMMILPPGGFLTMGLILGMNNYMDARKERKKREQKSAIAA